MVDTVEHRAGDEAHEAGGGGGGEVATVAKRGGRHADQEVTDDPARECDSECEHDDAEKIKPGADASQAAAETEHEGAGQVEDEDQGGVKAGNHRFSLSDGRSGASSGWHGVRRPVWV